MDILSDIVRNPVFANEEVERLRAQNLDTLQVAMHRPPALRAICPMYFTDRRYTDDCHYKGGAMQMLYDVGTYGLSIQSGTPIPDERLEAIPTAELTTDEERALEG